MAPISGKYPGGGGGTAAFPLGPEQNEFSTVAALSTYSAANVTWLADYDSDRTLLVLVAGTTYYRRNVGGTDWEIAQGVAEGESGPQARFTIYEFANSATKPTIAVGGSYVVETNAQTATTGTTATPTNPPANQSIWQRNAYIDPLTQSGTVTPAWGSWYAPPDTAAIRAETAQAASEAAQAAAQAAATSAGTAETDAEAAQVAAETAQTGAETAQAAAVAAALTAQADSDGTVLFGTDGPPADTLGSNGDSYWTTTRPNKVYKKIAGAWALQFTVTGTGGTGTDATARASIATETAARKGADQAEAIARDAKDVSLANDIGTEKAARAAADTTLTTAAAAADTKAVAARVVADAGVLASTTNTTEIAAVKVLADAAQTAAEVDADVSVETTARIAADAALGARITALPVPSGVPTRALYVGWSAAKIITAVATLSTSSDSHVVTIPAAVGNMYFGIWRADVDGGDPADVYLSGGGGNIRPVFGAATNFAIAFAGTSVPGKLIVTSVLQSAPLWSGQVLKVG